MKKLPNILTIFRILLAFVFVFLFLRGIHPWTLIVFCISAVTDFFDGLIARKFKIVSDFGKFADPLADKILVFAALILFTEAGITPSWIVIFVLFREFTITGLRMVFSSKGVVIPAMVSGKIKTTIQMFAVIGILVLMTLGMDNDLYLSICNYSIFIVTLVSFIDYLYRMDLKRIF